MIKWLKSFKSPKGRVEYLIEKYMPEYHLHKNPARSTKEIKVQLNTENTNIEDKKEE